MPSYSQRQRVFTASAGLVALPSRRTSWPACAVKRGAAGTCHTSGWPPARASKRIGAARIGSPFATTWSHSPAPFITCSRSTLPTVRSCTVSGVNGG